MLELIYSNDTDVLCDRLAVQCREQQASDPLQEVHVVVPNRNVESWLQLGLARHNGVSANLTVSFLEKFLGGLVEQERPSTPLLTRDHLLSGLLEVLSDEDLLESEPLRPVFNFIHRVADDQDAQDLRRHQLAERLCGLLEKYSVSRPEILNRWAENPREPVGVTESWQRHLWRAVTHPGTDISYQTLNQVLGQIDPTHLNLPTQIHVFGLSYMAGAYHGVFERLSRACNVRIYTATPILRKNATPGEDSRPVELWGRPGIEHRLLLGNMEGAVETEITSEPTARKGGMLHEIQRSIVQRSPVDWTHFEPDHEDDSISLLGCPGIQREAEVIASRIWSLVGKKQEGQPPLRFSDIAVVVPSRERTAYQTRLAAAFSEQQHIPHSLSDIEAGNCGRIVGAVLKLVDIPLGRFTRPEILSLLREPSFLKARQNTDPHAWVRWCEALNIHHGADRKDHDDTYIDRDVYNWDQGLRRLVLGAFMSPESGAVTVDGEEYLPLQLENHEMAAAGSLALAIRSLVADARWCRDESRTFEEWSGFFRRAIATYFASAREEDEVLHGRCLAAAADLASLDRGGVRHSYRIAAETLRNSLGGLNADRGNYLAGGVSIACQLPMRPIPFRAVFVCGLQEGGFPVHDEPDTLDLTHADRHEGDVTPTDAELFMFLETLTFTRENLVLSWVNRVAKTGESLDPCSVVREIQSILPPAADQHSCLHPLENSDPVYFLPGNDRYMGTNHSPGARRQCESLLLRRDLEKFMEGRGFPEGLEELREMTGEAAKAEVDLLLGAPPPPDVPDTMVDARPVRVSLGRIRNFLECPLQASVRQVLRLHDDEDDDTDNEDEAFGVDPLTRSRVLQPTFIQTILAGSEDADQQFREFTRDLIVDGSWPTGSFGEAVNHQYLDHLQNWFQCRNSMVDSKASWQRLWFGHAPEDIENPTILPPPTFEIDLADPNGQMVRRSVEIHGELPLFSPGNPTLLHMVPRTVRPHDFLRLFVGAVALATTGQLKQEDIQLLVLSAGDKPSAKKNTRLLASISPQEAEGWLRMITEELLSGVHSYLLPFEAVNAWNAQGSSSSLAATVNELVHKPRNKTRSSYGPIKALTRLSPLSDNEATAVVKRRFSLFYREPRKEVDA